ncbi:MAG: hypothetical protein ACFE0O_01645 [Opitutales bacterium]
MKSVTEIEDAISELPEDQFAGLVERLGARLQERWDRQLEADAASGQLDALFEQMVAEDEKGVALSDFLDDQKLS